MTVVTEGARLIHSGTILSGLSSAAADAWHSDANFEVDKNLFGDAIGPLVVDTALTSAGSLFGAGLRYKSDAARAKLYSDVPVYNMTTLRQLDNFPA